MAALTETVIATGLTGNANTSVAVREDAGGLTSGDVVVTSTVGATPTVTVNIQGSADGASWFNIPYALVATPSTYVVTAVTITTAVTTNYLLQGGQPWVFFRLALSANTNVTISAAVYL